MKSTDLARKDREIRKSQKRNMVIQRKGQRDFRSPGDFINEFVNLFYFDTEKIHNINVSEDILQLLEEMKEETPEKQWGNILSKAIKKTKIKQKDTALKDLTGLGDILLVNM